MRLSGRSCYKLMAKLKQVDSVPGHQRFINELPDYDPAVQILSDDLKETINIEINRIESVAETVAKKYRMSTEVHSGTSGFALYFLTRAVRHKNNSKQFEYFITKARKYSFQSLDKLPGRVMGFLNGKCGVFATAAAIESYFKENGQITTVAETAINKLIGLAGEVINESHPNELFYGRAGYLYSLLFVNSFYENSIPLDLIYRVANKIMQDGVGLGAVTSNQLGKKIDLMWEWHEKSYLGGAHGVSGILHTLNLVPNFLEVPENNTLLTNSITQMCQMFQNPDGQFTSSIGNRKPRLVQWCHGSPSWVMVLGDYISGIDSDVLLDSSKRAADFTWKEGLIVKGRNLCHGISGNGFCLLDYYHKTKDLKYLHYAAQFAAFSLARGNIALLLEDEDKIDQHCSLMLGELGHSLFLSELLAAEQQSDCLFPSWSLFKQ